MAPTSVMASRQTRIRSVGMARMAAAPPRMKPRLKMLDPTMLPTEIESRPSKAATSVTPNSGAEVPKATTVSPMTSWEIPIRSARAAAESTTYFAPTAMAKNVPITMAA